MPVRVCDRCVRFLVGVRPGPHDAACPYCEGSLRVANSEETHRFIEELRRPSEAASSAPAWVGERDEP